MYRGYTYMFNDFFLSFIFQFSFNKRYNRWWHFNWLIINKWFFTSIFFLNSKISIDYFLFKMYSKFSNLQTEFTLCLPCLSNCDENYSNFQFENFHFHTKGKTNFLFICINIFMVCGKKIYSKFIKLKLLYFWSTQL